MKKNIKLVAIALFCFGCIMCALGVSQVLMKEEGLFFNSIEQYRELAIIFFTLSLLSFLISFWVWLKPVSKKIPFGYKFENNEAVGLVNDYYKFEGEPKQRFETQKAAFSKASIEKKSNKIPMILALYAIGYSILFYLYRSEPIDTLGLTIVDWVLIFLILGSSVAAGLIFKHVYIAWSIGITVSLVQLIWFPFGTLAGAFLLSQLLPAKPPPIKLRFKADRLRRRYVRQTLLHAKNDISTFSRDFNK